jgi:hypothetical protein
MPFPEAEVAQLLADCKRHCCVCFRWCGSRMHLHHIHPRADGGSDAIENAIPVCLDCHAEIESRSNMGRRFSRAELHEHKHRWLEICRERPEVIIQAGRRAADTGPLEALLSELRYNSVLLSGEDHRTDYATPSAAQFERAVAANALAALPRETESSVFLVYKGLSETADAIRSRMQFPPGGNTFNVMSNQIRDRRQALRGQVGATISLLEQALGGA